MSDQIIQLLVAERNRLERVIQILQGSSPKVVDVYDDPTMPEWVKPKANVAPAPKKRGFSAARRRKMAEGQKRRWAAINAAKAETSAPKKKTAKETIAEVIAPKADEEFKSKMSIAMAKSWKKRKAATKKKKA